MRRRRVWITFIVSKKYLDLHLIPVDLTIPALIFWVTGAPASGRISTREGSPLGDCRT
jgi:hypothetical protein